jgi:branched-chain amino acid transport system ATP-binding protein
MLIINNIEVSYNGVVQVLRGISVEVGDGEIVALLGANGAGKTTTIKSISGLLRGEDGEITAGSIYFNGKRIDKLKPVDVASMRISQVMEGRRVLSHLTVEDNLALGAYRRKDRQGIKDDLKMVFDYFPIVKQRRHQRAGYLSGGEQQMLVIGRALMAKPTLMLLDEPSLGLAPIMVQEIYKIIEKINKEQKMSILLVEQNARAALGIADFGYIMENGKIVLSGPGDKLKNDENVREFYMGMSTSGEKKSYHEIKHYRLKKRWVI